MPLDWPVAEKESQPDAIPLTMTVRATAATARVQGPVRRNEETQPPVHDQDTVQARRIRRDGVDALLTFAEALARIAATGGGAQAMSAHLAATIDAAVLVEDADWKHLGLAGSKDRALPPSVRDLLPANADDEGEDGVPLQPPADARARAYPIRAGGTRLGWLSIFPHGTGVADRRAVVRLTAAQIAIELSREAGGSRGKRRSFWDRLLSRAYEDPLEAREDAQARGIALAPSYVAVAIEGEGLEESVAAQKMPRSGASASTYSERAAAKWSSSSAAAASSSSYRQRLKSTPRTRAPQRR
jgi:hypothetical protein